MSDSFEQTGGKAYESEPGWTKAVHSPDGGFVGLAPAMDPSVAFASGEDGCDGEYIYGRTCHPTGDACASALAELEGAERCLLTNSGMAAISTTLLALLKSGDHVIAPRTMYQPTRTVLGKLLAGFGIEVSFVDARYTECYVEAKRPNTKVAWIETPANPTLDLTDLGELSAWAKEQSILTVADNTFSTPMGTRPLDFGVDIVVHSATKYLAGHGDLLAGAILTTVEIKNRILPWLDHLGSGLTAHGAWMLRRGISTFPVRYERHQSNAHWIAEWLQSNPGVEKVFYPGLANHPQREIYRKQMKGGGGVVSFILSGGEEAARRFLCSLKMCAIARSLGEPRTLVAHPWSMHYCALTPDERLEAGVDPGLIRVAVGLESPNDIYADIENALKESAKTGGALAR